MKNFLQKFSMLQIALGTFFLLFAGTIAIRYFHPKEKNEYEVVYQDTKQKSKILTETVPPSEKFQNNLEKDPNFRYAERLREASALAVSLSVSEFHDRFTAKKINNQNLDQVFQATKQKGLLPDIFKVNGETAVSGIGAYYVHYSVNPFGIEIISVGANGFEDGEIFALRLPAPGAIQYKSNEEPELSSAALWISPTKNTQLPQAFASDDFYLQAGWRKEIIRINDVKKIQ
ncbi:MAG TPA: hypothetical protein PKY82_02370 [Pyrinomonadaceae bacterium]|nr:hypothetical protein [Pyrinomonadaceae bacterium]